MNNNTIMPTVRTMLILKVTENVSLACVSILAHIFRLSQLAIVLIEDKKASTTGRGSLISCLISVQPLLFAV